MEDSKKKYDDDVYATTGASEIVATAEPTKQEPIPSGHQRFYCSKCQTVCDESVDGWIDRAIILTLYCCCF